MNNIDKAINELNKIKWLSSKDIVFIIDIVNNEYSRDYLLSWNAQNDRNGCYLDKDILQEYDNEESMLWSYRDIKEKTLHAFDVSENIVKLFGLYGNMFDYSW